MAKSKKKRKGGLPASYIKKYGVSKKAWSEYRKGHAKGRSKTPKRRSSRRSATTKTKRTTKRRSNNMNFELGGSFGKSIIGGVAVGIVNQFIPINIAGADYLLAGMLMKNKLMTDLGAITLGRSLAGSITGGLLGGGRGNGGFGGY